MRDAPVREHKLHLRSYLRGARGASIAAEAARAGRLSVPELHAMLDRLGDFELYLPVRSQRQTWRGTGDVVVMATTLRDGRAKRAGIESFTGYRTDGTPVAVPLRSVPDFPLISVVPVEATFGVDPERARAAAPQGKGGTVELMQDCYEDCGGGGGWLPAPTYAGWYMDRLAHRYAAWSYDNVPFGDPEFEVYIAKRDPFTLKLDSPRDELGQAACAGDGQGSGSPRHFDYNNPPNVWALDFLVAAGTLQQLHTRYGNGTHAGWVVFIENDDTSCPSQDEPSLSEFNNGYGYQNDDDLLNGYSISYSQAYIWDWYNPSPGGDPGLFSLGYSAGRTF
jgi:hypothetical protein